MRTLSEIVWGILDQPDDLRITKEGTFTEKRSRTCVEITFQVSDNVSLPEDVRKYLIRSGINRLDWTEIDWIVYERPYTLRRLSDGKEETFPIQRVMLFCPGKLRERLLGLGFRRKNDLSNVQGFYMQPGDYLRLGEFLKEAGVRFEFDAPPWLSEALPLTSMVKPSPDRPGKDAARFLGYG